MTLLLAPENTVTPQMTALLNKSETGIVLWEVRALGGSFGMVIFVCIFVCTLPAHADDGHHTG